MGIDGVDPQGPVEAVLDPHLGTERRQAAGHGIEGPRSVLALDGLTKVTGLARGRGIELIGPPDDLDVVAPPQSGHRGVEAAGPQIAPGADDVGPDVDAHGSCNRPTSPLFLSRP